ncbi:MAG TPA: Holliday junction resolvase RuvX [Firmicutes bacterium]|jgi:putative holliday junction resolvase|nr:Holliday junction resolvase RuvX [Bacillota bacterium]
MRWLGLDLGERRIGLALSDPMELTAQPFSVWQRKGSLKQDLNYLSQVIQDYEVTGVVLGLPRNMNGSEGIMADKARDFGTALTNRCGISIEYWDERLSTVSAQRVLIEADMSRRERKGKIDQVAAGIILQNFLDFKNGIKMS